MLERRIFRRLPVISSVLALLLFSPVVSTGQQAFQTVKKAPPASAKKTPVVQGYDLKKALGSDFSAFAKVLKVKVTPKSEVVPEMEPGVSYSDEELAALPRSEDWSWKSQKVPGLSSVFIRRSGKDAIVKYFSAIFPKGKPLTTAKALEFFKLPTKGVEIEETTDRGVYEITNIVIGKNRWNAFFIESNDDEQPELQISWEEWIP